MSTKQKLTYILTLEVEIKGTPDNMEEMYCDLAQDIMDNIPGVLCDKGNYVICVDSLEVDYNGMLDDLTKQAQELNMGYN